jgi:hypothetical protein
MKLTILALCAVFLGILADRLFLQPIPPSHYWDRTSDGVSDKTYATNIVDTVAFKDGVFASIFEFSTDTNAFKGNTFEKIVQIEKSVRSEPRH